MEIKGYTYGYGSRKGLYRSEEGRYSQERMYELGLNWECLAFSSYQDHYYSTEIYQDPERTPADEDLIFAIQNAHEHGVKLCLKPMVDCKDFVWRARVDFPDTDMRGGDPYWSLWFESYRKMLTRYARLAEENGCEMLCIGCEMVGTERKEEEWRKTIEAVRKVYHGPLVYNTNHGKEMQAAWYDAIDYIGTSAYFPVADGAGATLEMMEERWQKVKGELRAASEYWGKKIVFMEIGCRSAAGCAAMPWDFMARELPVDQDEQANFYESCIKTMKDEPWFAGFFWWDWSAVIYHSAEQAEEDRGFNIHLKKAEQVVRKYYGA